MIHTNTKKKQDVVLEYFAEGKMILVGFCPRRPGVSVPAKFRDNPTMALSVGLNMPVPVPDLIVDDNGIFGTFSFERQPFRCRVPWHAVYMIVDHNDSSNGAIWTDAAPAELQANLRTKQEPVRTGNVVSLAAWKRNRGRA